MTTIKKYTETKQILDTISSTMCFAKWSQVSIRLGDGYNHSCHHPAKHKIPLSELKDNPSALHNTKFKKLIRKQMIEGVRPSECNYCWVAEDSKQNSEEFYSDRIKKSAYSWSRSLADQIVSNPNLDINPSYLEVSFNNTCNLKCSYCSPFNSSKWAEEIKQYGGYPTSDSFNNIDISKLIKQRDHNPYIEAFWKWWPDVYKDLKVFRITGGEPLLSNHTFDVIDMLIKSPKEDLEFSINTNLSVPDNIIDKLIEKLQQVNIRSKVIYTSCEGHGNKGEYGRFGLDYNKWRQNCEKIIKNIPGCKLSIMSAYNALSVTSFSTFVKDVLEFKTKYNNLFVDTAYVRNPFHQSIFILDDSFEHYFIDHIKVFEDNKFTVSEINNVKRLYSVYKYRKKEGDELIRGRKDFVKFVDEHDKRRKTDFLNTFPEMEDFYYKCLSSK